MTDSTRPQGTGGAAARVIPHGLIPMGGRDPHEAHRTATPLELLYDLTFVVAISLAGNQLAHQLEAGHVWGGVLAFLFAMFSIVWCWINYSWFASAFDTDDWGVRLATLVQMVGVTVLGLGFASLFHGFEEGHINNRVMVAGYVIMRLSMIFLWLRVARENPECRPAAKTYALGLGVAQLLWVLFALIHLPVLPTVLFYLAVFGLEFATVVAAERKQPTPWHAHHIAERYSLLAIITIGEVVLGTTTAVSALVDEVGWSLDAVVLAVAGIGMGVGLWWTYFSMPFAELLHARRERSYLFGFGHIPLYATIAAVGSGLHVAAYYIEGVAHIGPVGTVLTIAVPLLGFYVIGIGLYALFAKVFDPFHLGLLVGYVAVLAAAVAMAAAGVGLGWCIAVLMLAPWVVVVGYETVGHRHIADHLEAARGHQALSREGEPTGR